MGADIIGLGLRGGFIVKGGAGFRLVSHRSRSSFITRQSIFM
jgi:hypothetical protein